MAVKLRKQVAEVVTAIGTLWASLHLPWEAERFTSALERCAEALERIVVDLEEDVVRPLEVPEIWGTDTPTEWRLKTGRRTAPEDAAMEDLLDSVRRAATVYAADATYNAFREAAYDAYITARTANAAAYVAAHADDDAPAAPVQPPFITPPVSTITPPRLWSKADQQAMLEDPATNDMLDSARRNATTFFMASTYNTAPAAQEHAVEEADTPGNYIDNSRGGNE